MFETHSIFKKKNTGYSEAVALAETESFCQPLQHSRHDLFVGFVRIPEHKLLLCSANSICLANIGSVSSYQHRLASSLPGLRSSTFIQTDT